VKKDGELEIKIFAVNKIVFEMPHVVEN